MAKASTHEATSAMIDPVEHELRERLEGFVYEPMGNVASAVHALLCERWRHHRRSGIVHGWADRAGAPRGLRLRLSWRRRRVRQCGSRALVSAADCRTRR